MKTVKSADPLMVDFSDITNSSAPRVSGSGSLNNEFSNQENQTGEIPSDEVIRNRRR